MFFKIYWSKVVKALSLLAVLFFCVQSIHAKHIVGGEITYECLGNVGANSKKYEVTVTIYRDALSGGAEFDSKDPTSRVFGMTVFLGSRIFREVFIESSQLEISKIPIDDSNPCVLFPSNLEVERGVYKTILELPISNEPYTISYQRCCRNEVISNIINPGEAGATYTVDIPPTAQRSCNSSPVFKNLAPLVICEDFTFEFDHSATDKDGDDLVYTFETPYFGGGNNTRDPMATYGVSPQPEAPPPYAGVNFVNGFTDQTAISSDPPITIDRNTGKLVVKPTALGIYVICVTVSEYRNGELIGKVRRDFQFNVVSCKPRIESKLVSDANQSDVFNNFHLYCGDTIANLNILSAPLNLVQGYSWDIQGALNKDSLGGIPIINARFPGFGTYKGVVTVNPGLECLQEIPFTLKLVAGIEADFDVNFDTCVYKEIGFIDKSVTKNSYIDKYLWNFGTDDTDTTQNPNYLYSSTGSYVTSLIIQDNEGCKDTVTKAFDFFPLPLFVSPSYEGLACEKSTLKFSSGFPAITDAYNISWNISNGFTSTELEPSFKFDTAGNYDVSLYIKSPTGCELDSTIKSYVKINQRPIAQFQIDPLPSDIRDSVVYIQNNSQRHIASRWFDQTDSLFSRIENPTYSVKDTGQYQITLITNHRNGCLDTATQAFYINPFQTYFLPNALSLNQDNLNEGYRGTGYFKFLSNFKLQIFNRWGELIWKTNDPNEFWEGYLHDTYEFVQPGVYLAIATFDSPQGFKKITSEVTVLR